MHSTVGMSNRTILRNGIARELKSMTRRARSLYWHGRKDGFTPSVSLRFAKEFGGK